MKKRTSRNPPATTSRQGPEWSRRYSQPFEESIDGKALVHYAAELDRCLIVSPNGGVKIGESHLVQCVVIEPCTIGDGVVAIAAILQGEIHDGCRIEAHADIQGTLLENVTVGRGVSVEAGALVGPGSTIGDMTVIHELAEVGSDVDIGAQSDIGEHSYVADGLRLTARSVVRPEGYAEVPADTRQGPAPEPTIGFQIVPDMDDVDVDSDDEGPEEDRNHTSPDVWEPSALSTGQARPDDMAVGEPRLIQRDYQSGSARSWVLSKLGRIANLKSSDGRLTKKLVQEWRPELLEHPVTKEVLRVTPPITDEQLAELSYKALSGARYDVYGGISFHSGQRRDWQMLGPKANDVFVFAVPQSIVDGMRDDRVRDRAFAWEDATKSSFYVSRPAAGGDSLQHGEVVLTPTEDWEASYFPGGYGDDGSLDPEYLPSSSHREDAKRIVEDAVRRDMEMSGLLRQAFEQPQGWHPDRNVPRSVGWVRLLVYPRQTVVVVEIQSDRPWMKFRFNGGTAAENALRDMYFKSFADDVLNFVVEWAFNNRYGEVLVLDHASRVTLGGSPPKSFYDDAPKRYTISPPVPLVSGPFDYIRLYDWVPKDLKVRRIIPNRSR